MPPRPLLIRTDPEALTDIIDLHAVARPCLIDISYGRGSIYGRLPLRDQVYKVDSRELPGLDLVAAWADLPRLLPAGQRDVLIVDPIHVGDVGARSKLYARYVDHNRPVSDPADLFPDILTAAEHLLTPSGVCLVKLVDHVHLSRYQWLTVALVNLAAERGWTACQPVLVVNQRGTHDDPKHITRYHLQNQGAWWIVLRRGESCQGPGRRLRHTLVCASCGSTFTSRRGDARTCSGACKKRLNRAEAASV